MIVKKSPKVKLLSNRRAGKRHLIQVSITTSDFVAVIYTANANCLWGPVHRILDSGTCVPWRPGNRRAISSPLSMKLSWCRTPGLVVVTRRWLPVRLDVAFSYFRCLPSTRMRCDGLRARGEARRVPIVILWCNLW